MDEYELHLQPLLHVKGHGFLVGNILGTVLNYRREHHVHPEMVPS